MKATRQPWAPFRGAWSIMRTPLASSCATAASMSSTSKQTWWMPGPGFARNLPMGHSEFVLSRYSRRGTLDVQHCEIELKVLAT